MAKLGDIATYVNGYAFKPSDWSNDGLPIIRIQDLTGNSYETHRFNGTYDARYEINNGDILISWSASLGVYVWTGGKALLNQHIFKVVFDKVPINKSFFTHQVERILEQSSTETHGSTMKHLTKPVFDALPFYYPCMEKQVQIALILDKVNALIELHKRQLAKLDELVKARFVEMFGDPVNNSKHFPVRQLADYISFLTSGSRGWAKYYSDCGEWFITITNVKDCKITTENIQHITPPHNAEAERTRVQEEDLLISITADLGRTGIVTKQIAEHGAYINQHLTLIRLNRNALDPCYVAFFMESEAGKRQFYAKNQNSVKAGLNFDSIRSLQLLVPPLDLQECFAAFVWQSDKSRLTIRQGLDKMETLKRALMQTYFG